MATSRGPKALLQRNAAVRDGASKQNGDTALAYSDRASALVQGGSAAPSDDAKTNAAFAAIITIEQGTARSTCALRA
jgi:hypothetical protein